MTVADIPFRLPTLIVNVVDLPYPPSVNALWRQGKGRTYLSARYKVWKVQADLTAMLYRRPWKTIRGAFAAEIDLNRSCRRGNTDADNRIKAVLDYAQSRELVANDKFCERVTIRWVDAANAPEGARLTLRELSERA